MRIDRQTNDNININKNSISILLVLGKLGPNKTDKYISASISMSYSLNKLARIDLIGLCLWQKIEL